MVYPDNSRASNQILLQIVIPFIGVLIFVILLGYFFFNPSIGDNSVIRMIADLSFIFFAIPLFFLLLFILFLFITLCIFFSFSSKPLVSKLSLIKTNFIWYEQKINKFALQALSPIMKLESLIAIFKLKSPK